MTTIPDNLRALAQAATPGPWTVDDNHPGDYLGIAYGNENGCGHVATVVEFRSAQEQKNAHFIAAASPDVVLAMLDRIAELEQFALCMDRDRLQSALNRSESERIKACALTETAEADRDRLASRVAELEKEHAKYPIDVSPGEWNHFAELADQNETLRKERDAVRAEAERYRAVYEAAKTWCETVYIGKPHPRFPAYPGDELLHAVNAIKHAISTADGGTP